MAWKSLFRKNDPDHSTANDTAAPTSPARGIPPHLAQAIERRAGDEAVVIERTPEQRKQDRLNRQRMTLLFDLEQGETALSPDNPWTQRIALLGEALETVEHDVSRASIVKPGPFAPLPADRIDIRAIQEQDDVVTVSFAIGTHEFVYAEEPDWADRSRLVTRSELRRRVGDPGELIPANTPDDLRRVLLDHLHESLFIFASDLRDRMLDHHDLPTDITLQDMAAPCPVCGGWTDWRETCQTCSHRLAELAALRREQNRLLDEQNREAEERHRLIEGLPLARRRLKDVEAEIARAEGT